jgi:hypothetical protein
MLLQKAKIVNNQIVITESKEVKLSQLTPDCWLVQIEGLEACKNCEFKNTPNCGGGESLKRILKQE